jgi:hypothetical protein
MLLALYLIPIMYVPAVAALNCTVTVPVVEFCVIVSDTLLQLASNTLLPLANSNRQVKLPVVIV